MIKWSQRLSGGHHKHCKSRWLTLRVVLNGKSEHVQEFPKHSPHPLIFGKIEKHISNNSQSLSTNLLVPGKKNTHGSQFIWNVKGDNEPYSVIQRQLQMFPGIPRHKEETTSPPTQCKHRWSLQTRLQNLQCLIRMHVYGLVWTQQLRFLESWSGGGRHHGSHCLLDKLHWWLAPCRAVRSDLVHLCGI